MDEKNLVTQKNSHTRDFLKMNVLNLGVAILKKIPFYLPLLATLLLIIAPEAPIFFNSQILFLPQESLSNTNLGQYNNFTLLMFTWALSLYTFLALKGKLWEAMVTLKDNVKTLRIALYASCMTIVMCALFFIFTFNLGSNQSHLAQNLILENRFDKAILEIRKTEKNALKEHYLVAQILQIKELTTPLSSIDIQQLEHSRLYLKANKSAILSKHWVNTSVAESLIRADKFFRINLLRWLLLTLLLLNFILIFFQIKK